MKINKSIEIVRSTNAGLSSMSQESCNSICAALSRRYARVSFAIVNNLSDLESLAERHPDLVFLGMEFVPANSALGMADPNKIWVSDYLDEHRIAYTGSNQIAHEFERNKPLAKKQMLGLDLSTAAFCVIRHNEVPVEDYISLSYPLFVKPSNRGGGLGIDSDSVVYNFEQLRSRVDYISTRFKSDSLVEEYLPGREFSVAILKDTYLKEYLVMPIELVAPSDKNGARLLSNEVKSSNAETVLEVIDDTIKANILALALASFHAIGARDYGRIDIRLDAAGVPHFLEANLIPSLISNYGSFPKACKLNIGLEYEPMIYAIAELGLSRNLNEIQDVTDVQTIGAVAALGTV